MALARAAHSQNVVRQPMADDASTEPEIKEPTYWRKNGWSARVIKNEDDDGWAVEIRKAGMSEPALISPWVMGRDKKNPKPFDEPSFATFVKTASEVIGRAQRQHDATMTRKVAVAWDGLWYNVVLTIIPDEYDPHAILTAIDDAGTTVATCRVAAQFSLTRDVANNWARDAFPALQRG